MIHLSDRSILKISGKNVRDFLHGTLTNNILKLETNTMQYNAHLTSKGKFIFDMIVTCISDDIFYIDCNKNEIINIAKALHQYDVSRAIEFDDASDDFIIAASFENETHSDAIITCADPRSELLGTRLILPSSVDTSNMEPVETYHHKRISLSIPDGSIDGLKERTLINEMSFEDLNGVSFTKGCYVGQELTARTKHRTEPKKRIFTAKYSGPSFKAGTSIRCGKMEAGWAFSNNGETIITILRTREIAKGEPLLLNDIEIHPEKPVWASFTVE